MSTPLTEVDLPGIGARRTQRLVEAGYHTVYDLAQADPDDTSVDGVPAAVLRGAIHAARELDSETAAGEVLHYPEDGPSAHVDPPEGSEADVVPLPSARDASDESEASVSPRAVRSAVVRSRAIALDVALESARRTLKEAGHKRARKARKELGRLREQLVTLSKRAKKKGLGKKRTARSERLLDNLESALARFAEDGPTKKGARRLRKVARRVRKGLA